MLDAVTLDVEKGVFVVRYSGRVDFDDIRNGYSQMSQHPEFRPGLRAICDLRSAELELSGADIRMVAVLVQAIAPKWGESKWLAVVGSDVTFGLLRMFISLTDYCSISTMVVRNAADAGDWLGPGATVSEILDAADRGAVKSGPAAAS